MSRPRVQLALALALVGSLLVGGCLDLHREPLLPMACFGSPGTPLGFEAKATSPPVREDRDVGVNRTALEERRELRLTVDAGPSEDVHRSIGPGEAGVLVGGPPPRQLQVHVEVQESDVMLRGNETPRLHVNLSLPLEPGAYHVCVLFQTVGPFTQEERGQATVHRNVTAP